MSPYQAGHAFGFLEIEPGPLYVYIANGYDAVYTENSIITMDGSDTFDPDFFAEKGNFGFNMLIENDIHKIWQKKYHNTHQDKTENKNLKNTKQETKTGVYIGIPQIANAWETYYKTLSAISCLI